MRRLLLCAALAAGCGDGKGYLEVHALGSASGIAALDVTATLGGVSERGTLALPAAPASLPLAFAVTTNPPRFGKVHLRVVALDRGGAAVASGEGDGELRVGEVTRAAVVMSGPPLVDGGVDLAMRDLSMNDFAMNDFAMPDLSMNDLSMNDLSMNDLSMPDLQTPDLQTPDLQTPDLQVPDLQMRDLQMPDFQVPDLQMPDFLMPDLQMPDLQMPDLQMPDQAMCVDNGQACVGKSCGTRTNNCGVAVACGMCANNQVCVSNVCCTPQSDNQLCQAHAAACGSLTATDNCGTLRAVNCGGCMNGLVCSVDHACVVCRDNADCYPGLAVCSIMQACAKCTVAADCTSGGFGNLCGMMNVCTCGSDNDCTNPRAPRCDPTFHICACGNSLVACNPDHACSNNTLNGVCL